MKVIEIKKRYEKLMYDNMTKTYLNKTALNNSLL